MNKKESVIVTNIANLAKKIDEIVLGVEQKVYGVECKLKYKSGKLVNLFIYNSKGEEKDLLTVKHFRNIDNVPSEVSGNLSGVIAGTMCADKVTTMKLLRLFGLYNMSTKNTEVLRRDFHKSTDLIYAMFDKKSQAFMWDPIGGVTFAPQSISYDHIKDKGWSSVYRGDIRDEILAYGFSLDSTLYVETIDNFSSVEKVGEYLSKVCKDIKRDSQFITSGIGVYMANPRLSTTTGRFLDHFDTEFYLTNISNVELRRVANSLKAVLVFDELKSSMINVNRLFDENIGVGVKALFMRTPFSSKADLMYHMNDGKVEHNLTCGCGYKFKKKEYKLLKENPVCPGCQKG